MPAVDPSWALGGPNAFDFFARRLRLPTSGVNIVTGSASVTLAAGTVAATSKRTVYSAAAVSPSAVTVRTTSVRTMFASASAVTLGSVTTATTSLRKVFGTATAPFAALTVSASSDDIVGGTATVTLAGVTVTATGPAPPQTGGDGSDAYYLAMQRELARRQQALSRPRPRPAITRIQTPRLVPVHSGAATFTLPGCVLAASGEVDDTGSTVLDLVLAGVV